MRKNKSTIITLLVLAGILLVAGWYTVTHHFSGSSDDVQKSANLFKTDALQLTDLEGTPVSLDRYDGSVVVANSWATWCPFCKDELAAFAQLAARYQEQGVVVIAVNRAETLNQIVAYQKVVGTFEGVEMLLDESDSFYNFIDGFSMPETVFFDRKGNPVYHKRGPMKFEEMQEQLEAILQ